LRSAFLLIYEETAIAAGYRPCGACMREKYAEWKNS